MSKPMILIPGKEVGWRFSEEEEDWDAEEGWIEEEIAHGSYFKVVGFEKKGDAIPKQSRFLFYANDYIRRIQMFQGQTLREPIIVQLFQFLLLPAYAAFHRTYSAWRAIMNAKCEEYRAAGIGKELLALCREFQVRFPP
jgi:hypothetical protein